ncbi:TonB-dependent hemoglobin/transferrin/lactoferrin family receptor [Agrobacterium leguminum]|uniref:TonB-dependent hemoglobin/transferrin/lactoferrin family receptor n=1 Tax=Agrobacterium leguminum TaxID=2792015 RepID=UPI003CE58658
MQNLDDLGNTTEPGVSYVSASKSVNIRGLEDDRVVTTVDGISIPYLPDMVWNADGGADTYDFTSLASVSILRGADSSRAGSGALGGGVVLRTIEAEDLIKPGKDWGGFVKSGYDGSDRSVYGSAAVAKRINNTSILFQGSYKKGHEKETQGSSDITGSSRTVADPADYHTTNVLFKLRHDIEGGHQIGLTAEQYHTEKDTDKRSSYSSTYTSYDYHTETTRRRMSLDYKYDAISEDALIRDIKASLYYQKLQKEEGYLAYRTTNPVGDYGRTSDTEESSVGFTGTASGLYETGSLRHDVRVGIDASFFWTHQYTTGIDSCSTNYVSACAYYHTNQSDTPDVQGVRFGAYLDDRIEIGDSGLSLTPGMRFDFFDYRPQSSAEYEANDGYDGLPDAVSDFGFSPKLRAEYELHPEVTLFAQWAMAFKAPTVAQLYGNYDNAPYYRTIGNPDLETEIGNGFEVGANLGDEEFGGRLSAFYNRYRNFIDTSLTAESGYSYGTYRYYNRNRVRIYGLEAQAHKAFDNGFSLRASLAYAKGEDLDSGEVLASVPPLKAIVGIAYSRETWGLGADWIGVKGVASDSTASFKAPGYGIVNLTGWWAPEQLNGVRLQAGIYNLFDKEYYDALETKDVTSITSTNQSFYSEPGRYFKLSLIKTF